MARLRAVAERRRRRTPDAEHDEPRYRGLVQQARDILARRHKRSGTAHLRKEDATGLAVLKHGVELVDLPMQRRTLGDPRSATRGP